MYASRCKNTRKGYSEARHINGAFKEGAYQAQKLVLPQTATILHTGRNRQTQNMINYHR